MLSIESIKDKALELHNEVNAFLDDESDNLSDEVHDSLVDVAEGLAEFLGLDPIDEDEDTPD